jgi:PPK2 family polyphosphate:nucleotide phosphotransferase
MDYRKEFAVEPGSKVKLRKIDPAFAAKHMSRKHADAETDKYYNKLGKLQYLMYAEGKRSLLVVLQAMDAGGKDGTVRHVMGAMNPQSATVTPFKQPTWQELKHDFLWRVHPHVPAKGAVAVFNRSHYEDVLVVRVHNLVPKDIWSKRYNVINDFEKLLYRENKTNILKFFLHISPEEQLERFRERLIDPGHNWKISEDDYKEREYWDDYMKAYEDVFARTSTSYAPWYIIPSNHKWFRNLAVSQIIADTLEELGMQMPKPQVDLDLIRKKYHDAAAEAASQPPSEPDGKDNKKKAGKRDH